MARSPVLSWTLIGAAAFVGIAVADDEHPLRPPPPQIEVVADKDGFIRVPRRLGEIWPGFGVVAVEGPIARLEPHATHHAVYVRAADGTFERRGLAVEQSKGSSKLPDWFLQAARAAADVRTVAGTATLLDRILLAPDTTAPHVAPPPPPAQRPADDVRDPPPPGADLAAWAPPQFPFVRFRTVEAALRFCDLADKIGARVLAASGDGRDYGALRWALHDLVLPEVWNANPSGEKGVGECGLIVAGRIGDGSGDASAPGRPEIAVVFRITDPELHAMETASGVGYAAMPEHTWNPADDPEPATRGRRNFRRTVGDVEVVATSARLLDLVARPRKGPSLADGPAWRAARGAAAVVPDEAFLLVHPAEARFGAGAGGGTGVPGIVARGVREARGLAALWKRWCGLDPGPAFLGAWDGPAHAFPASLTGLLSVRCTTDAKGGDVAADFADERSAEAARAALEPASMPFANGASPCRANRRDVALLARVEPAAKDLAERAFVVLGWRPVCPSGGTYAAHPITREVSCSLHGSDTTPLPDLPALKPLIRDLRREGAVVRFRVPIDWR